MTRKTSVIFLGFITLMGNGIVIYFSGQAVALATLDFWVGTFCIFILATVQTLLFSWVLGAEKGLLELQTGAEMNIPRLFVPMIKYVSPVYLLAIFIGWLFTDFRKEVASSFSSTGGIVAMAFIVICLGLFLFLIRQAVARWNRKEAQ